MGLPKIIQIPCHLILANQNALKFKGGAPLKQFFNINLGIGIIKKILFLFVFLTYLLVFWVARPMKSMLSGYLLDVKFYCASNELSQAKFE